MWNIKCGEWWEVVENGGAFMRNVWIRSGDMFRRDVWKMRSLRAQMPKGGNSKSRKIG